MRHRCPAARPSRIAISALLCAGTASAGVPALIPSRIAVPPHAQRLAAADLDGDGDHDLVVLSAGRQRSDLTVLINAGGSTFATGFAALLPKTASPAPADLDLADLDLDGDIDLVIHVPLAASEVRLNDGNGNFTTVVPLPTSGLPIQHALGLMDGDLVPDLATYGLDPTGMVAGRPGVGNGTFLAGPVAAVGNDDLAARVELADVTGDGVLDLARASSFGLEYLAGQSGTGFPGWGASTLAWFDSCADLELAHLDGDAFLDAVVTIPQSGAIEVFHGLPGGGLWGPSPFPGGHTPGPLAVGDLDLDGNPDVVTGNVTKGTLTILPGQPGGIYLDFAGMVTVADARRATDIIAADLDGDGDIDLAATLRSGQVLILRNTLLP